MAALFPLGSSSRQQNRFLSPPDTKKVCVGANLVYVLISEEHLLAGYLLPDNVYMARENILTVVLGPVIIPTDYFSSDPITDFT